MLKAGQGLTEDLDLYLPCAIRAVRKGVGRAHLIDRDKDGGLLLEFFTPLGVGTVLTRDPLFRLREATIEDVGALASVIGGLADCPVIAVPTSIGYGASFQGLSALLSMLNSCSSGVSVVNIDNGFGAGYLASMINHMEAKR